MTAADLLAISATAWGVLMALAPLLQIRRMLHTRSSRDVSLLYLLVLLPGFVLWLAYGLSIENPALIISNIAALAVMVVTIAVALVFRRGKGRAAAADERIPVEVAMDTEAASQR